ncbi:hypothetical protein SISSUDRAFT_1042939 [Sistotremastrum suecicum HHB10207 ss-3]|uniref:4a-hydroxytetrahydrobiopterin dehydratase n=1 Tax=Sistotremastrum suecicum HHB10207 ss-3 TaxID=1314776 RepID=A0A166G6N8_9AGAM|nr:hypothetical protein SISSUDRAFT_1042939 [Sistotremastrum suecicum HHB10207 ss-3]
MATRIGVNSLRFCSRTQIIYKNTANLTSRRCFSESLPPTASIQDYLENAQKPTETKETHAAPPTRPILRSNPPGSHKPEKLQPLTTAQQDALRERGWETVPWREGSNIKAISKVYTSGVRGYTELWAFATQIAMQSHMRIHHPRMTIGWKYVRIVTTSASEGQVTSQDKRLADFCDFVADRMGMVARREQDWQKDIKEDVHL